MINILNCCKIRLKPTLCLPKLLKKQCQKNYCEMMKTSERMEQLLKKSDHIPISFQLIYRQKHYKMASVMHHMAVGMAFTSFGIPIYIWYQKTMDPNFETGDYYLDFTNPWQCGFLMTVNFVMLMIAHTMRRRWPIRIYKDPNKKTCKAIFHSSVPFHFEYCEFPLGSLSFVSRESSLPWRSTLYNIEGSKRKIMLFEEKFRTHDDFYKLLKKDQMYL